MRHTLTVRDKGVEALLARLPEPGPDNLDGVRRWAVAFMSSASQWQIDRASSAPSALRPRGGAHGVR